MEMSNQWEWIDALVFVNSHTHTDVLYFEGYNFVLSELRRATYSLVPLKVGVITVLSIDCTCACVHHCVASKIRDYRRNFMQQAWYSRTHTHTHNWILLPLSTVRSVDVRNRGSRRWLFRDYHQFLSSVSSLSRLSTPLIHTNPYPFFLSPHAMYFRL